MKRLTAILLCLALAAPIPIAAHDRAYTAYTIVELTGARGAAGSDFGHGVELGFKEINRGPGVITRRILTVNSDTESDPRVARAAALDAIDNQAYVVIGPLFSESIGPTVEAIVRRGIPIMIGGDDAEITQSGNPFIFRAMMSKPLVMGKLARYLKGKNVAAADILWTKDDSGTGAHEAALEALGGQGVRIGADVSAPPSQADYTAAVASVKASNAEAVIVQLNEAGSVRALRELRRQGVAKLIIGTSTLVSGKVIESARDAANGVQAFVEIAADLQTPAVQEFRARYRKAFRRDPDEGALCGFAAAYVVKAATEKVGNFNTFAFVYTMKNLSLSVSAIPELFVDLKYDATGEIERGGFVVEVRDGKTEIVKALPLSG